MRIFITGSSGLVGKELVKQCTEKGYSFVEFDISQGLDILDKIQLRERMSGCTHVVHCAALLGEEHQSEDDIYQVNVVGTKNVLEVAEELNIEKVIFLSSADVLGIFKGESAPKYFPIDDMHPCTATTPYGKSKIQGEQLCKEWSERTGASAVALRPPGVWNDQIFEFIAKNRKNNEDFEWDPYWEFGAFCDVRDVCELALLICISATQGYKCYLLTSTDASTTAISAYELAQKIHPTVPWNNVSISEYSTVPSKTLIDCTPVYTDFGWKPTYTWEKFLSSFNNQ